MIPPRQFFSKNKTLGVHTSVCNIELEVVAMCLLGSALPTPVSLAFNSQQETGGGDKITVSDSVMLLSGKAKSDMPL